MSREYEYDTCNIFKRIYAAGGGEITECCSKKRGEGVTADTACSAGGKPERGDCTEKGCFRKEI